MDAVDLLDDVDTTERSATNRKHWSGDAFSEDGAVQFVFFRFSANGGTDDFLYFFIRESLAQGGAQIDFFAGKETGPELSVRGHTEPVAAGAEMV